MDRPGRRRRAHFDGINTMKVYIGPYKNWFGPYQIAEKILFWIDKDDDRVHRFGEFLAHGFSKKEDDDRFIKDRPETWLYKLCLWIDKKKERKIKIYLDRWDTWSMDHTLALIVLPMLKQLKATKHGSPLVDIEDVPEHLRPTEAPSDENGYTDNTVHERWDWVMDEMIFAFEHKVDDSWQDAFRSGEHDLRWVKDEKMYPNPKTGVMEPTYRMEKGPNDTYECDYEGMKKVEDRIQNGFRLFGKYYSGLWD